MSKSYTLDFKYVEDAKFFAALFKMENVSQMKRDYSDMFDFRPPTLKRREFNALRGRLLEILRIRSNGICEICKVAPGVEVDHRVPLSTNFLNKELRNMRGGTRDGKKHKAPSESYGSNRLPNLQLACKACNRKKWHRLLPLTTGRL